MRNYFQKYLPAVQEISPEEWAAVEAKQGTSRYEKARDEFISARLDRRVPRVATTPEIPPPVPPAEPAAVARRGR